jgi:WD40 repeat protein
MIWNIIAHRQVFTYALAKNRVSRLMMVWSPNSRRIAIAGNLGADIQIWDIATGKQVVNYGGHGTAALLYSRTSSEDGEWLLDTLKR